MDEYDCRQTDKQMSKKIAAIYSNPQKHRFVSIFQLDHDEDRRGPRGGKIRGRKTICGHCGGKRKGHADKDEQI